MSENKDDKNIADEAEQANDDQSETSAKTDSIVEVPDGGTADDTQLGEDSANNDSANSNIANSYIANKNSANKNSANNSELRDERPPENNVIDESGASDAQQLEQSAAAVSTDALNAGAPANANDRAEPKPQPATLKAKPPWLLYVVIFAMFVMVLTLGGSVFYGAYVAWQELEARDKKVESLVAQLDEQVPPLKDGIAQVRNDAQAIRSELKQQISQYDSRIKANEQRINTHSNRLRAMSTTTREDWLLAEAEYLLKLANQRVLIERSATGADALLVEADNILRDLDDPDLYSLRQAIANDIAALRVINKIDVEGLYLRLAGLTTRIPTLPLRPTWQELRLPDNEKTLPPADANQGGDLAIGNEETEDKSVWQAMTQSFKEFMAILDDYVRVRDHDNEARPVLPPDAGMYIQQNLRMTVERAQLALIRQEQVIYRNSIDDAIKILENLFPDSGAVRSFIEELRALRDREIVQDLPDISTSYEILRNYIEQLHNLGDVKSRTTKGKQ